QAAVEEMAGTGKDDDRKLLRPGPGEDVGEWDHVVLLTMDDQRIRRHGAHLEAAHGGTDQHHALDRRLRVQPIVETRLHVGAEGESREHDRMLAEFSTGKLEHRQGVLGLADALVEFARAATDAAKIETRDAIPELKKSF